MFLPIEVWPWWAKGVCSLLLVGVMHYPLRLNMRQVRVIACKCPGCTKRARICNTSARDITERVQLSGKGKRAIIGHYLAREYRHLYLCPVYHISMERVTEEVGRKPDALWKDEDVRENKNEDFTEKT